MTVCSGSCPSENLGLTTWISPTPLDAAHPNLVTGKAPTPDNIAAILENGYAGPIGNMPNEQANGLSSTDVANLVAYLVSLK